MCKFYELENVNSYQYAVKRAGFLENHFDVLASFADIFAHQFGAVDDLQGLASLESHYLRSQRLTHTY